MLRRIMPAIKSLRFWQGLRKGSQGSSRVGLLPFLFVFINNQNKPTIMEAVDNTTNEKVKAPYKLVHIQGGNVALSYIPEIGGVPALVELVTLRRIIKSVQDISFTDMKDSMIGRIIDAKNMKDYMDILQKEISFHMTCNAILETDPEKAHEDIARAEDSDKEKESTMEFPDHRL